MIALWLMAALLVKHFVFDFPFQFKFMREQKENYLAEGGLAHAGAHGLGTAIVFVLFGMPEIALTLAIMDVLIHYHVDYFKAMINRRLEL